MISERVRIGVDVPYLLLAWTNPQPVPAYKTGPEKSVMAREDELKESIRDLILSADRDHAGTTAEVIYQLCKRSSRNRYLELSLAAVVGALVLQSVICIFGKY